MVKNILFQRSNRNILGFTDTVALSANEARFFRFRVFFGACSLQNEVGDPQFFCLFATSISLPLYVASLQKYVRGNFWARTSLKAVFFWVSKNNFTITAEIHARSLVNFYCQYAETYELEIHGTRPRARAEIRQFVIVKNKLMSVFNASVLLLTMNFVITLSK